MSRVIFVSGWGWSGSSAVIDCLCDQVSAVGLSGGYPDETALFMRSESPLHYLENYSQRGWLDLNGIVALLTGGTRCLTKSCNEPEIDAFLARARKKLIKPLNIKAFNCLTEDEIKEATVKVLGNGEIYNVEEVKKRYYKLLQELFSVVMEKKQAPLVINNDPNSEKFCEVVNSFPEAICISVYRNFPDRISDYFSRDQKTGRLKKLKRIFYIFKKAKQTKNISMSLTQYNNIQIINFDNFVLDRKKCRSECVYGNFSFEYDRAKEKLFIPDYSMKNIGAARKLPKLERIVAHAMARLFKL